jgi:hypothetical protein
VRAEGGFRREEATTKMLHTLTRGVSETD